MDSECTRGGDSPRPLASPVIEYRVLGFVYLVNGIVLGIIAVEVEPRRRALALLVAFALAIGAMLYPVFRHFLRLAAEQASSPKTPQHETAGATWRRVALRTVLVLIVTDVIAVNSLIPEILSGVMLGISGAALGISRLLSHWEHEHSACLLQEARYGLWPRKDAHQGFYVVDRP